MARRSWGLALASLSLASAGLLLGASPAAADDGLATDARSRYVLDAQDTTVEASITLDLRNVTTDPGTASYTYYDRYVVPVPAGAERVRATSGGDSLGVSLVRTDDPSTRLAQISFPELRAGNSRQIELTFRVPGEKPRSADSTRVGPGYATFAVYGLGDPGRNVVEVLAPASMTFDSTSDGFSPQQDGDAVTYRTEAADPGGFWAVVSLRDPDASEERTVDAGGTSFILSGFKDDPEWADFVADRLATGIPVLERLVGTPWPGGLERVREDASPSLRGYDGWFDPTDDEIVVGERLDDDLILHELSHAWVAGERFDERWVYEGLAQVLADRAVRETGGEPSRPPAVSRGDAGAVALNRWGGSAGTRSADVDGYAYPAAFLATSALVGGLDDDAFAAVLASAIAGERAYDPAGTTSPDGGRTSWSRWLDLVEERGGVDDAPAVFQRWALTPEQSALLGPRQAARAAYAQVDDADGQWLPPEGLRDAMTAWDFERADHVLGEVQGLGASVRQVQDAAEATDQEVPVAVRSSYEEAAQDEEYAALATSLPKAAGAIGAVGAAGSLASADRDPVASLGEAVLGVDDLALDAELLLDDGLLEEASAAAEQASQRAGIALLVGSGVILLALLVVGILVLAGWIIVRRVIRSERPQHPRVPEGVGLDPLQVQELGDPLVVGAQQLGVHRGLDRLPLDGREAVPREEGRLEGEAEQPSKAEVSRPLDKPFQERGAHPETERGLVDGDGADLAEVLPEHVQRPTADDPPG